MTDTAVTVVVAELELLVAPAETLVVGTSGDSAVILEVGQTVEVISQQVMLVDTGAPGNDGGDLAGGDPAGTAADLVAAHEAAADPHPQYLTQLEGDGRYAPVAHTHAMAEVSGLAAALNAKVDLASVGMANGVASLGTDGKILNAQLPALAVTDTFVVNTQAAMLALDAQRGDVAIRSDLARTFILAAEPATTLANWKEMLSPSGGVSTVFGRSGVVTAQAGDYSAAQITQDASNRFVSDAEKAAWNAKQAALGYTPANRAGDTVGAWGVLSDDGLKVAPVSATAGTRVTLNDATGVRRALLSYSNASAALTLYDTDGGTALAAVTLASGVVALTGQLVTSSGLVVSGGGTYTVESTGRIRSKGAAAAVVAQSRDGARDFGWYAPDGTALLLDGGAGIGTMASWGTDAEARLKLFGRLHFAYTGPQTAGAWYESSAGTRTVFVGLDGTNCFAIYNSTSQWAFRVESDGRTSIRNANSATLNRQPRIFVQSADPGAAAADGDLWIY